MTTQQPGDSPAKSCEHGHSHWGLCPICNHGGMACTPVAAGELPAVAGRVPYVIPSAYSGHDGEFYIVDGNGWHLSRDGKWARAGVEICYWPTHAAALEFLRSLAQSAVGK